MKYWSKLLIAAAVVLGVASCGGSSSGGGGQKGLVSGVALSVISGKITGNRSFQVLDLSKTGNNLAQVGQSNALGEFAFDPGDIKRMIVLFAASNSEPRTSGLISTDQGNVEKTLDGVTDIACVAGAEAIADGSVTAQQMDTTRIANLEAAAAEIVDQVDFTDPDSVNAAVAQVRASTNDGAIATGGTSI